MTPAAQTILVTGANGFVGGILCDSLRRAGRHVRRIVRRRELVGAADDVVVAELASLQSGSEAFKSVDAIVHLAARTHVIHDDAADPLAEYRRINVDSTRALALAAAQAGVRRFVYMSSIKVNGEQTTTRPYTERDAPGPEDSYGLTKWEAEQALHAVVAGSPMETVILRPPLLYGPGVKGNFLTLMRIVDRGLPLPFASIRNRRSLLYAGNLADAVLLSLDHPAAAGKTYVVADDEGISTPDLVRAIARAMDSKPRLLACPPSLLRIAARLCGKSAAASRVLGSLQVDASAIRRDLGWKPRYDLLQGLKPTAEWYYRRSHSNN